jgi:WD40 repeat protein
LNSFSGRQAEYGVTSIAFSPDGRALAATLGGLVKIWDLAGGG